MADTETDLAGKIAEIYRTLGANERALVDQIRFKPLRRMFIRIVGVKIRLQFTGWLQYVLPLPFVLLLVILAVIALLIGINGVATVFAGLAGLLLLVAIFDVVTVKFRIRPPERRPPRRDGLDTFDLMRSRRSCRSFQTRNLLSEDRAELMSSVQRHSAAAIFGSAPVRLEYVHAPLTIWPTVNAREFVVAIAPREYDRCAVLDVGWTLQRVVMDADRMGLGTCWIGPGADRRSISRELGDRFEESRDNVICVVAVGYASSFIPLFVRIFNARFNRRLPFDRLFFADRNMELPLDTTQPSYNRFGRIFEACQWAPSSYNGQTTRTVASDTRDSSDSGRRVRFDFFAATSSRYYAVVAVGIWCANWDLGCEAGNITGFWDSLEDAADPDTIPRYHVSWIEGRENVRPADAGRS